MLFNQTSSNWIFFLQFLEFTGFYFHTTLYYNEKKTYLQDPSQSRPIHLPKGLLQLVFGSLHISQCFFYQLSIRLHAYRHKYALFHLDIPKTKCKLNIGSSGKFCSLKGKNACKRLENLWCIWSMYCMGLHSKMGLKSKGVVAAKTVILWVWWDYRGMFITNYCYLINPLIQRNKFPLTNLKITLKVTGSIQLEMGLFHHENARPHVSKRVCR